MAQTLIAGAIYRFNRTNNLRYYQAGRTPAGVEYLSPIRLDGGEIVENHPTGRQYTLVYFITDQGKIAVSGYWLDTEERFDQVYITDATVADLDLVADTVADLPNEDQRLDDILNRQEIQVDMDVWGSLFQ